MWYPTLKKIIYLLLWNAMVLNVHKTNCAECLVYLIRQLFHVFRRAIINCLLQAHLAKVDNWYGRRLHDKGLTRLRVEQSSRGKNWDF